MRDSIFDFLLPGKKVIILLIGWVILLNKTEKGSLCTCTGAMKKSLILVIQFIGQRAVLEGNSSLGIFYKH